MKLKPKHDYQNSTLEVLFLDKNTRASLGGSRIQSGYYVDRLSEESPEMADIVRAYLEDRDATAPLHIEQPDVIVSVRIIHAVVVLHEDSDVSDEPLCEYISHMEEIYHFAGMTAFWSDCVISVFTRDGDTTEYTCFSYPQRDAHKNIMASKVTGFDVYGNAVIISNLALAQVPTTRDALNAAH